MSYPVDRETEKKT